MFGTDTLEAYLRREIFIIPPTIVSQTNGYLTFTKAWVKKTKK